MNWFNRLVTGGKVNSPTAWPVAGPLRNVGVRHSLVDWALVTVLNGRYSLMDQSIADWVKIPAVAGGESAKVTEEGERRHRWSGERQHCRRGIAVITRGGERGATGEEDGKRGRSGRALVGLEGRALQLRERREQAL